MKCPYCNCNDDRVVDSRPAEDGSAIRRRRECLKCGVRFTTYEKIEKPPLLVIKRDGTRELFDSNKLLEGIVKACMKRPVSTEVMEKLVSDIEEKCRSSLEKEVTSAKLGDMVMDGLKEIDDVAYVRFASVYREFKDVEEFMKELEGLQASQNKKKNENTEA
jgi:transcriptional repressor NrdR